jgi:hypothetical protein
MKSSTHGRIALNWKIRTNRLSVEEAVENFKQLRTLSILSDILIGEMIETNKINDAVKLQCDGVGLYEIATNNFYLPPNEKKRSSLLIQMGGHLRAMNAKLYKDMGDEEYNAFLDLLICFFQNCKSNPEVTSLIESHKRAPIVKQTFAVETQKTTLSFGSLYRSFFNRNNPKPKEH